jgi:hypothetical protein
MAQSSGASFVSVSFQHSLGMSGVWWLGGSCGMNCVPSKSDVKPFTPIPPMWPCWRRGHCKGNEVKKRFLESALIWYDWSLKRRGVWTQVHTEDDHVKTVGSKTQAQEKGLRKTSRANTLILDFQPLELWDSRFLWINHPICGTSLWQP